MSTSYFIIGLLLIGGVIFYFTSCKSKQPDAQQQTGKSDTIKVHKPIENHYLGLRDMALGVTPEQLNLSLPASQTKVYGVVMDWDLGDGVATFISFASGDASMYLSSGGGMIGGGKHENVKVAAKTFVDKAGQYLDKTARADSTPLPDKGCVRFYLLTNNGKFTAQEQLKNFENNSSHWLPLFEEGNNVITQLRLIQEKR